MREKRARMGYDFKKRSMHMLRKLQKSKRVRILSCDRYWCRLSNVNMVRLPSNKVV